MAQMRNCVQRSDAPALPLLPRAGERDALEGHSERLGRLDLLWTLSARRMFILLDSVILRYGELIDRTAEASADLSLRNDVRREGVAV